ncbi:MAG: hypothetical protein ACE5F5_07215 [Acidimicrobiia bacterium]
MSWPTEPVSAQIRTLFNEVGENGARIVAAEQTLASLLPAGITHNFWWQDHPHVLVVGDEQEAVQTAGSSSANYLLELGGTYPVEPWGWRERSCPDPGIWRTDVERSARHVASWADPVGLIALVSGDQVEVFASPVLELVKDPLRTWDPTLENLDGALTGEVHAMHAHEADSELENSFLTSRCGSWSDATHAVRESTESSEAVPAVVVFGEYGLNHEMVLGLEDRLALLAEVWEAVSKHETWGEISDSLSTEAKEFLAAVLDRLWEFDDLSDHLKDLRSAWAGLVESEAWYWVGGQIPEPVQMWFKSLESWSGEEPWEQMPLAPIKTLFVDQWECDSGFPCLNYDLELDLVTDALKKAGSSAIGDAIDAGEITLGVSMTSGTFFEVEEPEAVMARLRQDGIAFRYDPELVRRASGPRG